MLVPQRIVAMNTREHREEWHRSVIGKVYVLFGNLLLDAADHRSLEAATRAPTVFVAFQISVCSAEKSG